MSTRGTDFNFLSRWGRRTISKINSTKLAIKKEKGMETIPSEGANKYPPLIAMIRPRTDITTGMVVFFVA